MISTVATLLLVTIGGLVRSTNSGLGCGDDWPICNGKVVPLFDDYTVAIEYSHRFVAGLVIISIGLLIRQAFKEHRDRPLLIKATIGAMALVLFQAVLGAVVVKLDLKAESVVMHLVTAMLLFGVLIYMNVAAWTIDDKLAPTPDERISRLAWIAAGAVLFLLAVGSYVSGKQAGLAFTDWPLMDGRFIPDLGVELRAIQFFHRVLAAAVGIVVLWAALPVMRMKSEMPLAARLAHTAVGLFALEIVIGALNVWTRLNAGVVTLHLAVGAGILASFVAIALVTKPGLLHENRTRAPGRSAMEPGA